MRICAAASVIVAILLGGMDHASAATTILPVAESCFQKASGPISSGSVNMFVPGTTTPKTTWTDSTQATTNTQPIQLNADGCAIIYGTGSYRQQVYDGPVVGGITTGNLIFDLVTTDTSASNSVFWAGLAGGTGNAITITDAGFANTDGSVINFIATNTNTAAVTLNVSGGGAIPVQVQSSAGPVSTPAGCITAHNPISVVYSSTDAAFLLLTPCSTSPTTSATAVPQPQGYLSLSSNTDDPILNADVSGGTAVYYSPYAGNQIPIWNGTSYTIFTFNQLILTLTGSNLGNTIYDVCVFSNSGTPTIVTGPAWSNSAAGSSARGTGAGTTQLQRLNGLWVNAVQITGANGGATFTIPANQCTYVGSILIDAAAGTISNYISWGQNRKWSVWNAYNRQTLQVQAGDPTVNWNSAGPGWRASNATTANGITTLTGLAEQAIACNFNQSAFKAALNNNSTYLSTGIAINAGTITPTGMQGFLFMGNSAGTTDDGGNLIASNYATSPLGVTTFTAVENSDASVTSIFKGTPNSMQLQCGYRG